MGRRYGADLEPLWATMTGKSENIVSYTAEELVKKRAADEGRTDHAMSDEEVRRRRAADREAPQPYPGWEDTITVGLPGPKKQMTLRLDADVVQWFRQQGKGYQTLMNAVLKGYVAHQRSPGRNRDGKN